MNAPRLAWRMAALRNGLQDATAYRIEFLAEVMGAAVVPAAIQWVLWYAIFKVSGAETVNGMGYAALVQYTLTSLLFTQIRGGDTDFELGEMIRTGSLSNYLLRPVSVIEFVYLRGLGPKLLLAGFCFAIGITAGLAFGLAPGRLAGAMLMAVVGNVIHFQISAALASASFYWEEAYSLLMVKNMIVSLLSGELLPLNLFPQSLQWIWKSTPFYLYVFGPTQYALGRWSHAEFLSQFAIAGAWLVIGSVLVRISWGIGIRRYQGFGG